MTHEVLPLLSPTRILRDPSACRQCGGAIRRTPKEGDRRRRYCSRACFFEATRSTPCCLVCLHRMPWGKAKHVCHGPPKPKSGTLEIPAGAQRVPTWADVPPFCWICGGLLKRILGGVSCLTCGRDLYVLTALPENGETRPGWA